MNSCSRYLLAVWLLPRAFAFIAPVGLVSSVTGRSSFTNNIFGHHVDVMCSSRASTLTVLKASASSTESAVDTYRKFLGSRRWEEFGEPADEAALTYNEICDVYGEENAIKMVSLLTTVRRHPRLLTLDDGGFIDTSPLLVFPFGVVPIGTSLFLL